MNEINLVDLSDTLRNSLARVESQLELSYSPYSGLCVAAGLVLIPGGLVTGVNYESASYGLTQCAERNAIGRAQAENKIGQVDCLVMTARYRDNETIAPALTPCGACRQWLLELSRRIGRDIPVYSFWKGTTTGLTGSARDLLPRAYL